MVEDGGGIVFGEGRIWGIFPVAGDSENTYLVRYNCAEDEWETDEDSIQELDDPLQYPAITYQPAWYPSGHGRVFITGMLDEDYPMLFWYDIGDDSLDEVDIDTFEFGAGASLAHGPAWFPLGVPLYANPGWLFCLAGGGGGQFWRYAIPYELVALDSICPAESAVIADQTPPFKWSATGELHRLLVATDPDFNDVVLDEETESPQYETESEFDRGPYYWKTGTSDGLGAWSWSAVRYFLLDFGWVSLEPLPESADAGAALAYDHKSYYPFGDRQLVAFQGGGSSKFWCFYYPSAIRGNWTQVCMPHTPCPQYSGSALATPTLDANSDRPYAMFRNATQLYWPDFQNWNEYSALPKTPGNGASLTYAHHDGADWLYYVPGGNEDAFYRLQLSDEEEGGGQSQAVRSLAASARLLSKGNELALQYRLDAAGMVRVLLCDATGRVAAVLHSGPQPAGAHDLSLNTQTAGLGAGAYFLVLDAGIQQARLKVVLR